MWGRELAKFSTTQERINHLRGMLAEIGMTGRYSNEKAKKIKEERELAADLEAVQEGAKAWGAESSEQMKTRSSRTVEAPPKTRKVFFFFFFFLQQLYYIILYWLCSIPISKLIHLLADTAARTCIFG